MARPHQGIAQHVMSPTRRPRHPRRPRLPDRGDRGREFVARHAPYDRFGPRHPGPLLTVPLMIVP